MKRFDWYWKFTSDAKQFTYYSQKINEFINNVIVERKEALEKEKKVSKPPNNDDDVGIKERYALLDLLLKSNDALSVSDINEEVNTFMFAVSQTHTTNFLSST